MRIVCYKLNKTQAAVLKDHNHGFAELNAPVERSPHMKRKVDVTNQIAGLSPTANRSILYYYF